MKLKDVTTRNKQQAIILGLLSEITGLSVETIENVNIIAPDSIQSKIIKKFAVKGAMATAISKNTIHVIEKGIMSNPYKFFGLMAHELTHTKQIRELGTFKFAYQYTKEFKKNLKNYKYVEAYLRISFEQEAVENQSKFLRLVTDMVLAKHKNSKVQ